MSLYQNVSFPVREHLKLFQLSGRLTRRLFCIPWYFVVLHFISFNCKLLNTQFSHKEKETIRSVWSDLMTLLFPDWLTPPLFFLYIFAIPPGWFGRISKTTTNLSSQHLKKAIYNLTRSRSISSTNPHSYAWVAFYNYIFMHIRCKACIWLTHVKPAHHKLLLPTPKIAKYNHTLNLKHQPA